jgi:hypothetical protein
MGGTFVLQSATGITIEQWPQEDRRYPAEAHQTALAIGLALQMAALAWFAIPRRQPVLSMQNAVARIVVVEPGRIADFRPGPIAGAARQAQGAAAKRQFAPSRCAAAASASVCTALMATIVASNVAETAARRNDARLPFVDTVRLPRRGGCT